MKAFKNAGHLASWTGLCPGNRESGGKRMSGRTRKANCYVKRSLPGRLGCFAHREQLYFRFRRRIDPQCKELIRDLEEVAWAVDATGSRDQ